MARGIDLWAAEIVIEERKKQELASRHHQKQQTNIGYDRGGR